METATLPKEQKLTAADVTELKVMFNELVLKAKEKFGDKIRSEWNICDLEESHVCALYLLDSKAEWIGSKSGVTIEAHEGKINITDSSLPF